MKFLISALIMLIFGGYPAPSIPSFFREYNKFGQWKGASFLQLPTLADQNACLQRNKDIIGDTGRYIEGNKGEDVIKLTQQE